MRKWILWASLALVSCGNAGENDILYMLTGSYSPATEDGIKLYKFNQKTAEIAYVCGLSGISNPSYLTVSADGTRAYAVGEDDGLTSTMNAILMDSDSLTLLNSYPTDGGAPCYISLDPKGRFVLTANYSGGSVSVRDIAPDGSLGANGRLIQFEGSGPDTVRQSQPHLHCVTFTPDDKYLLANDLGTDKIHIFPVAEGETLLEEPKMRELQLRPGFGPRHIVFHPSGRYAYLIGELSGEILAFSYNDGTLTELQSVAADTTGAQGSADIHISPDGQFLYGSNRLKNDGIAIFAVNQENGTLTPAGYQLTGIHPRNFAITPNGRFLLVACRDSDLIQVFERDADTGLLRNTGNTIRESKPVCIKFL